jgi:hypothetical protein
MNWMEEWKLSIESKNALHSTNISSLCVIIVFFGTFVLLFDERVEEVSNLTIPVYVVNKRWLWRLHGYSKDEYIPKNHQMPVLPHLMKCQMKKWTDPLHSPKHNTKSYSCLTTKKIKETKVNILSVAILNTNTMTHSWIVWFWIKRHENEMSLNQQKGSVTKKEDILWGIESSPYCMDDSRSDIPFVRERNNHTKRK